MMQRPVRNECISVVKKLYQSTSIKQLDRTSKCGTDPLKNNSCEFLGHSSLSALTAHSKPKCYSQPKSMYTSYFQNHKNISDSLFVDQNKLPNNTGLKDVIHDPETIRHALSKMAYPKYKIKNTVSSKKISSNKRSKNRYSNPISLLNKLKKMHSNTFLSTKKPEMTKPADSTFLSLFPKKKWAAATKIDKAKYRPPAKKQEQLTNQNQLLTDEANSSTNDKRHNKESVQGSFSEMSRYRLKMPHVSNTNKARESELLYMHKLSLRNNQSKTPKPTFKNRINDSSSGKYGNQYLNENWSPSTSGAHNLLRSMMRTSIAVENSARHEKTATVKITNEPAVFKTKKKLTKSIKY